MSPDGGIPARLTGGSARSLGRTEEVVADVLAEPALMAELFDAVFNADEIVRMRAADALEKVCRAHPDWLARSLTGCSTTSRASTSLRCSGIWPRCSAKWH